MSKNITVVFTDEEAQAILQLIDAAVKAVGLNAAKAAFIIADKINVSIKNAPLEGPTGPSGPIGCAGVQSNVL